MALRKTDISCRIRTLILSLILFTLTGISATSAHAEGKRAFKLLEKGDYDKLVELLDKSIAKDSINAGARYVYSLLYLTPKYRNYSIDTAYLFINKAIADYELHTVKVKENLAKLDIDEAALSRQKLAVEQHAFRRAKAQHTLSDYNYFLMTFSGAVQSDSAIAFRNEIAFNEAVETDTYEAFQKFIHTYPDALQIEAAKKKYEELLYLTMNDDRKLESFERFLRNNPNSPFRDDAERNILEISAADHDLDSYMTFVERFPTSKMRKRALDLLYHAYKSHSSAEGFSNKFNILQQEDSLMQMVEAETGHLMAIFEMERYGFSMLTGEKLIDFTYSEIKEDYYCGSIADDFLEVKQDGEQLIVSRKGGVIFRGAYNSVEDIGSGALKIGRDGYFGVIHKSGFQILDFKYSDVGLVANAFIKYQFNGKWGLKTFSNRDVLPAEYEDIFSEGRFVIVKDKGLFAIQNVENLARAANLIKPKLEFRYDDYELIYASQLLLYKDDMETVMDMNLKENLALGKQNFFEFYGGWLVRKDGKYRVYDQIFYPLSDLEFDYIDYNKSRAALKYKNKWGIYNADTDFPSTFRYDSVRFLSEQIGIIMSGDSTFAVFDNGNLIDISYSRETRLLRSTSAMDSEKSREAQYLLTKTAKGIFRVFNIYGVKILDERYNSVEAMGYEYLLVDKSGKKGLVHKSGKQALKVNYDAIGNYDNGYVSTLISGKFGIYNYDKNVLLSTKYQKALKPFGSLYFIGSKGSSFGLVNLENKDVTPYNFDQILDWNDSVALVKTSNEWKLYDIKNKKYVFEGISEYKVLRDDDEEKILLITKESSSGILSNKYGLVVGPTFNDIVNIGTKETPVYFCEKYIREAEFYVVIYYDAKGKILRKQIFTDPEEYEKIYCG
jgi:hypothetical protein